VAAIATQLAIFDCDGVLVDSERLANRIFAELLTEAGLPTTFEDSVSTYLGRSLPASLALAAERLGRPLPPDLASEYHARLFDAFARDLEPVPGVVAALDALTCPLCVASSGSRQRVERALAVTGLAGRFAGAVFSADDVARAKPLPDLYLHAADVLHKDPSGCVVVEDSPAGVKAAVAAGMRALGYADLVPAGELAAEGATVFTDMADLPDLIM